MLLHVADELKLPLMQIARQAEAGQSGVVADLAKIQATAESALKLIDYYALGVRLSLDPQQLAPESLTVSSVLYDTGQELNAFAKNYGVTIELDIAGRYGPITANRKGLQAALVSLGTSLIAALPALESRQLTLQLATHRSRYGIVAGLYADNDQLTEKVLRRGRRLRGQSRQPLLNITHGSGAGIFVADRILHAMHLDLKASRHRRLYGFGMVLQPNHQMQIL